MEEAFWEELEGQEGGGYDQRHHIHVWNSQKDKQNKVYNDFIYFFFR